MSNFSRRQFLIFFGSSAAATALSPNLDRAIFGSHDPNAAHAVSTLSFTPVRLPHPLPIYQQLSSFYATGLNQVGTVLPAAPITGKIGESSGTEAFTVIDDVVVPPQYERYVLLAWGDRVFPNRQEYVGFNCDFTGYIPISGNNEGYLWVNHEYTSYPFSKVLGAASLASFPDSGSLVIPGFPTAAGLELTGEVYYNQGGSIVRIRKDATGRFVVVRDSLNRRIHGLSGLGLNRDRTDNFRTVTSWGSKSYQAGDQNYLIGTGPTATDVFIGVDADRLGNKIIGTSSNCSGGVTPWGTIMSAEENIQFAVNEEVLPNGSQVAYANAGAVFGLLGEKYGWMVELDPADSGFRPRKHTALGRFRHENITMRVEAGKPLVAYMGDDRRGGHTWKYVSAATVNDPRAKANSALLESGTLYVAQFNANGTGVWLPLVLTQPVNPVIPSQLATADPLKLRNAATRFPRRAGIAGQTTSGGSVQVGIIASGAVRAESDLSGYTGTLANYYASQGAVLSDAFLAANLIGGTPTARPEDLEISPLNSRVIFIAYTDGAPGGDGYPDSRVFQVGKYTAAVNATQQSGGLYKITEDSADNTGTTFRWERFAQGGEAGQAISGSIPSSSPLASGFANVDNLVFDPQGNIWGVIDMTTGFLNGFNEGPIQSEITINHTTTGDVTSFVGTFGNNWMFYIPTTGPDAGELVPFAYGPMRCEMTGPTFVGDTLILAVQHPSEDVPFSPQAASTRAIEMLGLDGAVFNQTRTAPRGSNWPSNTQNIPDGPPKPSVIGIRRRQALPNGTFI